MSEKIIIETKEIRCYLGTYKQGVNRCQLSGNGKSIDVFDVGWLDIEPKDNITMWQELLPHPETPARPDIRIEFNKLTKCEIITHGIYPDFKIIRCVKIKMSEKPRVQLTGLDGNAFAIMGRVRKALKMPV